MVDKPCEYYSDLFEMYADDATPDDKHDTDVNNEVHVRFYRAVRYLLKERFSFPAAIPPPPRIPTHAADVNDMLHGLGDSEKAYFLTVAGILLAGNFSDPLVGKNESTLGPDDVRDKDDTKEPVRIAQAFVDATVAAVQEYNRHTGLYDEVYLILKDEGTNGRGATRTSTVYARQLAEVTDRLVEQKVDADDRQIRRKVLNALATALGGDVSGRTSQIDVVELDLEQGSQAEVIGPNVQALSGMYCAAMLEELKFFATADKIAEQFTVGAVPVSRGAGGEYIFQYIKRAADRMTEVERRSLYARSFGLAQGSVEEPMPNRDFSDSWIRFLSSVSINSREEKSSIRKAVTVQQVLKSGRDLAVNLSLHGYGMAHFAAVELQALIRTVKQMLSAPEVLAAFGVKDCWQLTERISMLYLGGSVNSVRQRTMAQSGANIINWLAKNGPALSNNRLTELPGTKDEKDQLLASVENWLAVTGTNDTTVDRFSEPVSLQSQRTIPDFTQPMIPDAMRDAMAKMNTLTSAQLPQA